MTCIAIDRESRTIAADSANTDSSGVQWRMDKIEYLKDGRIFLGSGHCLTIRLAKQWADNGFKDHIPQHLYDLITGNADADEYRFTCLVVDPKTNAVVMVDEEMVPTEVKGRFLAIGSGAAYALGALEFGAKVEEAVNVAVYWDQSCTGPVGGITY